MVNVVINTTENGGYEIKLDGVNVERGCLDAKFGVAAGEIPTLTLTYAVKSLTFNGERVKIND